MSPPEDLQGLPWPDGEPGPLRDAAVRLRGVAGGLEGAGGTLSGAVAPGWSGVAQASYSGALGRAGDAVAHLTGSAETAAAAADARAEADAVRSAALVLTAPLTGFDPLAAEADAAGGRAAAAESTAAAAASEAARVERWAHGVADDAVADVDRADAACAGALEGTGMLPGLGVGQAAGAAGVRAVWDFVYDPVIKPFNPYDATLTPRESNTKWFEYGSGVLFGTAEWTSRYAARNWVRYEPGYWSRPARWVAPYTRSTPSGGTTQVSGYLRRGTWVGAREVADDAMRAMWAQRATNLGRGGAFLAVATAGAGQYFADAGNAGLDGSERTGRIVAQTATVGGASALGAWGGAAGGAALGTAICPGVGTVVGGVVGGIVGGGVAGGVVDHINDSVVDWAGDASNAVEEFAGDALDTAGDVLDDLTPW